MTNKTNTNYTPEMVEELKELYAKLGNDGLSKIAEHFNKPVRSIRSKLCTEKVYVASQTSTRSKDNPSKKEILRKIEAKGFDSTGFENATKDALSRLLGIISH